MSQYTYDPNVAKQQQALNQQGAGLKVDGFLGPLTQAAISRYGSGNTQGQQQAAFGSQPTSTSSPTGSQLGSLQPNSGLGGNNGTTQTPAPNPTGTVSGSLPTTPPSSSNSYNNPYLAQVQSLSQLSPGEVSAQQQLNDLQTSYKQGTTQNNGVLAPMSAISGDQQLIDQSYNTNQQTLQNKLALAQQQRQSALNAAQAGLEYTKPTSLSYGASLVNPATGATVNGGIFGGGNTQTTNPSTGINPGTGLPTGASTSDILGYLSSNGIDPSRYDMPGLINAIQNGATAQDIISGRAGAASTKAGAVANATVKSQKQFNPISGQAEYFTPTVGNGNSGVSSNNLGGFSSSQAVKTFQTANGLTPDGIVGPKTLAAMQKAGIPTPGSDVLQNQVNQVSSPDQLPTPKTYAQKSFQQDFTSGGLADTINAQNTAIGHLTAAFDLSKQMENWALQPGNVGKNFLASAVGKAAVDNYNLAHTLSSSELSKAYGNDTGGERSLTAALGSSNSSPEQLKGFVQTSAALLSSKILSNVQQYKTAYGQSSPINLNWFISPQNQQALAQVGIIMKTAGNDVGAYQVQPDGSAKKIQ